MTDETTENEQTTSENTTETNNTTDSLFKDDGGKDTTASGDDTLESTESEDTVKSGDADDTSDDDKSLLDDTKSDDKTEDTDGFDAAEATVDVAKELLPEGYEADDDSLKEFVDMVNGAQSRSDLIKGGMEMFAKMMEKSETAIADQWQEHIKGLKEETRNDPVFGGANYQKSLTTALEVVDTYAPDAAALKQMLTQTGAGNSVQMVGLLNKLAEHVPLEGKPVSGETTTTDKPRADKLFTKT